MRRLFAALVLLAGCDRVFDLGRDPLPLDAQECFGTSSGLFTLCPTTALDDLVLPQDIDTDDGPAYPCTELVDQSDSPPTKVCVITAANLQIRGAPHVHGGRPLVLIARHVLTIDAATVIDVASHRQGNNGAGVGQSDCAPQQGGSSNASAGNAGGGGGAGGGFHGPGGGGGDANVARGAMPSAEVGIGLVRAGCAGSRGGAGTNQGGRGGNGGGALYLIAGDRIDVDGVINASGAAGEGGTKSTATGGGGGGGGGGSGGLIGLDAPHVVIASGTRLVANGGGGGGGAGTFVGTPPAGADGSEAMVSGTKPFIGVGGPGGGLGGAGGNGAGGSQPAGAGASGTGGAGGGGGGAAGFIMIYADQLDDSGVVYSPPHGP